MTNKTINFTPLFPDLSDASRGYFVTFEIEDDKELDIQCLVDFLTALHERSERAVLYPSSLGGVNQPFFSCICTNDLKDCCARARLYCPCCNKVHYCKAHQN